MNVTVSVDDQLLERARGLAKRRGTSLQQLIRGYLRALVGEPSGADVADELLELMECRGGHSEGRVVSRADAYEGRL